MKKVLFLLFTLLPSLLMCDLADRLKPALNKDPYSRMYGIDYIYMINQDNRPDLYVNARAALVAYGIKPYRFSAVSEQDISPGLLRDISLKYQPWMTNFQVSQCQDTDPLFARIDKMESIGEPYTCLRMTKGTAANWLSHLSVLQDAMLSGHQTIWVLEDAIQVLQDPNILISLMNELGLIVPDWDILFTDSGIQYLHPINLETDPDYRRPDMSLLSSNSYRYMRRPISIHFSWEGPRHGAQSYIIKRSGIEKILNYFKENGLFLPYDAEFTYLPLKAIRLNDPVVTFFYPAM